MTAHARTTTLTTRARREAERLDVETNARFEGVSTEAATLLRQLANEVERLEAEIAAAMNQQALQPVGL
jgi:phage host-nuclease inhibitor protein Gam